MNLDERVSGLLGRLKAKMVLNLIKCHAKIRNDSQILIGDIL